jgi:DNA-binding beta-propeller fold protein YncE
MSAPVTGHRRSLGPALTVLTVGAVVLDWSSSGARGEGSERCECESACSDGTKCDSAHREHIHRNPGSDDHRRATGGPATDGSVGYLKTGAGGAVLPLGGEWCVGIRCRGIRGIHSTCSDKKIYALNIASNTVAYSFTVGACGDLVATPDGKSLYIGGSPTLFDITVATIATRSLAEPIFTGAPVGELTPSADRKKVYLSNTENNTIATVSTVANRVLSRTPLGRTPSSLAVTPDGSKVGIANSNDGTVSVGARSLKTRREVIHGSRAAGPVRARRADFGALE